MAESRKEYRAKMRREHGADWWKAKPKKAKAKAKAKKPAKAAPPAPRFRTYEQVVEEEGLADDVQERLRDKGWSEWPYEWDFWQYSSVSKDGKSLCYVAGADDSGYSGSSYSLCATRVGPRYRLALRFTLGYGAGGSEDPEDDLVLDLGTHGLKKALWVLKVQARSKGYVERWASEEQETAWRAEMPDED